jgi:hypothetical protein
MPKPQARHRPKATRGADNPEQYRRFLEVAKEVEADDMPGSLDRSFDQVVKPAKPVEPDKSAP